MPGGWPAAPERPGCQAGCRTAAQMRQRSDFPERKAALPVCFPVRSGYRSRIPGCVSWTWNPWCIGPASPWCRRPRCWRERSLRAAISSAWIISGSPERRSGRCRHRAGRPLSWPWWSTPDNRRSGVLRCAGRV